MGYSIARAAFILGAKVRLIHGPTSLKPVPYIINQSITSAQDLFECVKDIIHIMTILLCQPQ